MFCLACTNWDRRALCPVCRRRMVPVDPVIQAGLSVSSGYEHGDVARRLVHLLKYQGVVTAADPLAAAMAERIPAGTRALIPVPRAWIRRVQYGIDPAYELAVRVGRLARLPVTTVLRAHFWWPAHAGNDRSSRVTPRFRLVGSVVPHALLIDDVFTTGATLGAAARLTGVHKALTATRACGLSFDRIGPGVH